MSNRKHTAAGVSNDSSTAQENLNVLYTAHQVHTMAQFVYRHLAGAWRTQPTWAPNATGSFPAGFAPTAGAPGFAMPGTMPGAMPGTMPGTMPGAMPGMMPTFHAAPPALFYWYP